MMSCSTTSSTILVNHFLTTGTGRCTSHLWSRFRSLSYYGTIASRSGTRSGNCRSIWSTTWSNNLFTSTRSTTWSNYLWFAWTRSRSTNRRLTRSRSRSYNRRSAWSMYGRSAYMRTGRSMHRRSANMRSRRTRRSMPNMMVARIS